MSICSGTKPERERACEYLKWLCAQRTAYVNVVDEGRNDCLVVQVPTNCVAYVTGSKGSSLRRIEEISGTFIFLDGTSRGRDEERLLIFGHDANGRKHGKELVLERIDEKLSGRSNRNYHRGRSRSRSPYGGRDEGGRWWDRRGGYDHRDRRRGDYRGERFESSKRQDVDRYSNRDYIYSDRGKSSNYESSRRDNHRGGRRGRSPSASPRRFERR